MILGSPVSKTTCQSNPAALITYSEFSTTRFDSDGSGKHSQLHYSGCLAHKFCFGSSIISAWFRAINVSKIVMCEAYALGRYLLSFMLGMRQLVT